MKNIEKYYGEIKEKLPKGSRVACVIRKIRTGTYNCPNIGCKNCEMDNWEWLNSEYVEPIKLTKFEYDLLKSVSGNGGCIFSNVYFLTRMQSKGYFQNVDITMTINGILKTCEVIGNQEIDKNIELLKHINENRK